MHKVPIVAIASGAIVGIVGGLLIGAFWLGIGAAILLLGLTGLWFLAIWKKPRETFLAEAGVEAMASGYPSQLLESNPEKRGAPDQSVTYRAPSPPPDAKLAKDRSC